MSEGFLSLEEASTAAASITARRRQLRTRQKQSSEEKIMAHRRLQGNHLRRARHLGDSDSDSSSESDSETDSNSESDSDRDDRTRRPTSAGTIAPSTPATTLPPTFTQTFEEPLNAAGSSSSSVAPSSLSPAAQGGVAFGAFAFILLLAVGALFFLKRHRRTLEQHRTEAQLAAQATVPQLIGARAVKRIESEASLGE